MKKRLFLHFLLFVKEREKVQLNLKNPKMSKIRTFFLSRYFLNVAELAI